MRKLMLLTVVALLTLPALLWAQPLECPECKLGLWNEPELINNTGTITQGLPKDIYLGIKLGGVETGVTGIEFSITGIRQIEDGFLVTDISGVTDPLPSVILGTAPAPVDTTAGSTGTGGVNAAWPSCVSGSRALLKIQLLSLVPVSNNKVFKVLRKFPPTNTEFPYLLFTRCDAPEYTKVAVPGGCFIANWDGTTDPVSLCQVETAVSESTWSGMKQLYR